MEVILDVPEPVRYSLVRCHRVGVRRAKLVVRHFGQAVSGCDAIETAGFSSTEITNAIHIGGIRLFIALGPALRRFNELCLAVWGSEVGATSSSSRERPFLALLNRIQFFNIKFSLILHQVVHGHRVQFGRGESLGPTAAGQPAVVHRGIRSWPSALLKPCVRHWGH